MRTEYRQATLAGSWGDVSFTNREVIDGPGELWLTDLKGWFGGVGVDTQKTQRPLGHGYFPAAVRRSGRSLTLESFMYFRNDDDRLVADRFISGVLWDGSESTLTVTTATLTLSATVRLDGEIGHVYDGVRGVKLQVPLSAPDPFLYGPAQTAQVYPTGAGVGLRYPLFTDGAGASTKTLSYGKANPNTRAVIQNRGNATAYPLIRVVGDFPSGFVLRDSSNRTVEYPSPVWSQAPVEIDSREGAVYQSGVDQTYRCTHRSWFSIPAGGTDSYRVSSIQPGDGHAEIIHSDTYI